MTNLTTIPVFPIAGMALDYFFEHKDMECFNFKLRHKDGSNLCVPCWSRRVLKELSRQYGWENLEIIMSEYRAKIRPK